LSLLITEQKMGGHSTHGRTYLALGCFNANPHSNLR
jgi:hypothetical protein